ncbi:MAG: DUF952 domain-containing protein [Hamadaea sp.]|uniref:DUF952 domain-containing protein n=1 Tax=Hamadaea sp. TaxID=2024425 RepID=UPI0017E1E727|nr:DUF952 domain-containing protein [Hamadaea sp.]NUR69220.1 DUF952 domain-containing protein [Hamadaea sp.]NUT22304.1 DUF952 domain-containing protein [Hamadaea sp.]
MAIYKLLRPAEWAEFQAAGQFDGTPFDHESGFIHCSSREQVQTTALRVFGPRTPLVVLAVSEEDLGGTVKWELAPGRGEAFPHIYGTLPLSAVTGAFEADDASELDDVLPD